MSGDAHVHDPALHSERDGHREKASCARVRWYRMEVSLTVASSDGGGSTDTETADDGAEDPPVEGRWVTHFHDNGATGQGGCTTMETGADYYGYRSGTHTITTGQGPVQVTMSFEPGC